MKINQVTIFLFLTLANIIVQAQSSLKVGDKAPAIIVEKWVKGNPILNFAPGQLYVIEFSSISCGPCRGAIPHLTELTKAYSNKVKVVSVYLYDSAYRVERFVKRFEGGILYDVAVDGSKANMATTWMKAAGRNGIPEAFVIDKNGVVAWIGHPIELENVLQKLIDGDFDPNVAIADQKRIYSLSEQIVTATKSKNFELALDLINRQIDVDPTNPYYPIQKFNVLLQSNEQMAYRYGRDMLTGMLNTSEFGLFFMAREIVSADEKSKLKSPDWKLVIDLTERAFKLSQDEEVSAIILDTQAKALANSLEYGKAVAVINKAIKLLDIYAPSEAIGTRDYLNSVLQEFKIKESNADVK